LLDAEGHRGSRQARVTSRYRVTPRAFRDLASIARYTKTNWGKSQRDAYMQAIELRFAWLADNPGAGRSRPEVDKAYRSFPEGAHVIFYVVRDDSIDIVGVPHRSMDLTTFFGDEQ
ncbi:MAG: type II toxin-antitoxin system RelE/ParE family toxin, partial [Pseudomonadota bacterium]